MLSYLVLEIFVVVTMCKAIPHGFTTYGSFSSPVSYGASSHSNWYTTTGNRRYHNDRDIFKHSEFTPTVKYPTAKEEQWNRAKYPTSKEEQWDRVDKHVYLHVLPLTSEEIETEGNKHGKKQIEKINKNDKEIGNKKEKLIEEADKLEDLDEIDSKKWDGNGDEKKVTHVDKHIYLHVLSPTVNHVTVKHPVFTSNSPTVPKNPQRFPKKTIPAVPVIPVIPLEPEIYLVRKTRAQSAFSSSYDKRSTTATLKPDTFYV